MVKYCDCESFIISILFDLIQFVQKGENTTNMEPFFDCYQSNEFITTNRILNTPSDFARKNLFYVQETGYVKSLKSHLSKRSSLNSYLFMIVLSGKGTVTYGTQSYHVQSFDCTLIDCRTTYSHISDEQTPWELMWVHFNGNVSNAYFEYIKKLNDIRFQPKNYTEFIHILEHLKSVLTKKSYNYELICSKFITDLLTLCITSPMNVSTNSGSSIQDKLQLIRDYLDSSFKEAIRLDDLSNLFFISKYHLSREFKRYFGITISDYINAKRITFAKEELRFTSRSIQEIASRCGIPDATYFNKVFKKSEAMTASNYRKKWQG